MRFKSTVLFNFKTPLGGIFPVKSASLELKTTSKYSSLVRIISIIAGNEIELTEEGTGILSFTGDKHHIYQFYVKVEIKDYIFFELIFDKNEDMLDSPKMATISTNRSGLKLQTYVEFTIGDCKEVLILTGHNYKPRHGKFAYRQYAYTRMHDLAYEGHFDDRNRARKGKYNKEYTGDVTLEDSTVITHLDCQTGQMSQWVRGGSKSESLTKFCKVEQMRTSKKLIKNNMWAINGGWCRIKLAEVGESPPSFDYDKSHPDKPALPGEKAISITHVYTYIQNIGRDRPGTLVEFSIYSHSFKDGPILFNTYEDAIYEKGGTSEHLRDRKDHDGRYRKDFKDPNMTPMQQDDFRNAFSGDSFIKLNGCFYIRPLLKLLKYASISNSDAKIERYNEVIIDKFYKECYAYYLSEAIGRPVWSGAPGVSADRLWGHSWFVWPYIHVVKQRWIYNMNKRQAKRAGLIPVELRPGKRIKIKDSTIIRTALYYYLDILCANFSWDWYMEYDAEYPLTPNPKSLL